MRKLFSVVVIGMAMLMAQAALAADNGMAAMPKTQLYAVLVKHAANMDSMDKATVQKALTDHLTYLDKLYDDGVLVMAGPFTDDSMEGLGLAKADSAEAARALFQADPAFTAGLFTIEGVHPWWLALSKPDGIRLTPEMMAAMAKGQAPMPAMHGGGSSASTGSASSGGGGATTASAGGAPQMATGGINFIEFPSKNVQESQAFYSKLFGWEFMPMPGDSPEQTAAMANGFLMFNGPGGAMGAFSTMYKPTTDGPVVYVNCNGVKAKLAEIEAAGGKTMMASMKLPADWGYIGTFTDPHGNVVGLWSPTE